MELKNENNRGQRRNLMREISTRIKRMLPIASGMRTARAIRPLKMAEAHRAMRALLKEHDEIMSKYSPDEYMAMTIDDAYADARRHIGRLDLTREEIAQFCKDSAKYFSNSRVVPGAIISTLINMSSDNYFELDFTDANAKKITPAYVGYRNTKTLKIAGRVDAPCMEMARGYAEILAPGLNRIAFRIAGGEVIVFGDAGILAGEGGRGGSLKIIGDAAAHTGRRNNGCTIEIFGNVDIGTFDGMRSGTAIVHGNARYGIAKDIEGGMLELYGDDVELEKIKPGGHAFIYYKGRQIYRDGERVGEI